jgi:hypothetical protein
MPDYDTGIGDLVFVTRSLDKLRAENLIGDTFLCFPLTTANVYANFEC